MKIEIWLPIILSFMMAVIALITLTRTGKKDTSDEASQRASMTADIRYIRTSIDDIKLENRVIQKDVSDLGKKVVEVEASVKSAHKRLDDLRKDSE